MTSIEYSRLAFHLAAHSILTSPMSWQSDTVQHAFAFERAVVTPYTFATVLAPALFSFYLMAVLVQLPRTSLPRIALLPVVFWMSLRAGMSLDFSWNDNGYAYLNQGLALAMFTISMRSTVWVLNGQTTYTRLPVGKSGDGTISDHDGNTSIEHGVSISVAMWNALDLIANLRGIGWNGLPKIHTPAPYFCVESRLVFVLYTFSRIVFLAFASDALGKYVRYLGRDTFGVTNGGTIFDPSLPPLERYMKSSTITFFTWVCGCFVMEMIYQVYAALFTILFQQHPSQWPPLFDSPWLSTSLTSLWGRRWHQIFRECFMVVGYKPLARYFGRVGGILGAFALSGLLHDIGMRGMGGKDTLPVVGFFMIHGIGVASEYIWEQATGRHVGGVIGLLWVYFIFILSGQLMVDTWARSGLLASGFYPDTYSPTIPFLKWISGGEGQL